MTTSHTRPDTASFDPERVAALIIAVRDQIVLRNARAQPQVRDAVDVIAAQLERVANGVRAAASGVGAAGDDVAIRAQLALLEAKDRLALLDDVVRTALQGADKSRTFIGEAARATLALERLETGDLYAEKRRQLIEERRRFEAPARNALRELNERAAELLAGDSAWHDGTVRR